jgi:hypothetical protein
MEERNKMLLGCSTGGSEKLKSVVEGNFEKPRYAWKG